MFGIDIVVDVVLIVLVMIEVVLFGEQCIFFDVNCVDGLILFKILEIDDFNLKDYYKMVECVEELCLLWLCIMLEGKISGYFVIWNWSVLNDVDLQNLIYFQVLCLEDFWVVFIDVIIDGEFVMLSFECGGIVIWCVILIDEDYMFIFEDMIINNFVCLFMLSLNGYVCCYGVWKDFLEEIDFGLLCKMGLVYQGLIGVFDGSLIMCNYKNLLKNKGIKDVDQIGFRNVEEGGWIGFIDMYWMVVLIFEQGCIWCLCVQQKENFLEFVVDVQDV